MKPQPIETAPQSGINILVYTVDGWGIVFWNKFAHGFWCDLCGNHLDEIPTHWLPMPPPPTGDDPDDEAWGPV